MLFNFNVHRTLPINIGKMIQLFFLSILFFYLFILQIKAIWPFTIDDMFISLRYASHLISSQGLVWNSHEAPVEGYSNFSFVLLAALAQYWKMDPVYFLKYIGVAGLFLSCLGVYWLSRLWFSVYLALIPCFWMLVYRGQIIWAVSGLETTMFQAIIVFHLVFLFRGLGYRSYPHQRTESNQKAFLVAALLLAVAGLTRPETGGFAILFYSLALWDKPMIKKEEARQKIGLSFLMFAFLFVPYFLWRWYYFGSLFPNSVNCKMYDQASMFVLDKNYLKLTWPFLLLGLLAVMTAIKRKDKSHFFLWLPSILYLFLLMSADPIVAFYNRLFLPAFLLLLPLALRGLVVLMKYFFNEVTISSYVVSFLIAFFLIPSFSLANYRYFTDNPQKGEMLREQVVHWLDMNAQSKATVFLADSGKIPYQSRLRFIDTYCLNNSEMTKGTAKNRYQNFCDRALSIKPDIIILTSLNEQGKVTYTPTDRCLMQVLKKTKAYHLRIAYDFVSDKTSYRYEIYARSTRLKN